MVSQVCTDHEKHIAVAQRVMGIECRLWKATEILVGMYVHIQIN